jgi:hypothetical protein
VKAKLKKRKIERSILNAQQMKAYTKLLELLQQRRAKTIVQREVFDPEYAKPEED